MLEFIRRNLFPTLAGFALIYIPFLWCRVRREDPKSYGLSWDFTRRSLIECLIMTVAVLLPLTFMATHWPWENLPRHSTLLRTLDIGAAGIAAAIIEEIFFRGWVQPLFRKHLPAILAIGATSVLFALAHVFVASAPFLIAVFFPGCVMGFLRERHGNIATSTLFHGLSNIWAIWLAPLQYPSVPWLLQKLTFLQSQVMGVFQ